MSRDLWLLLIFMALTLALATGKESLQVRHCTYRDLAELRDHGRVLAQDVLRFQRELGKPNAAHPVWQDAKAYLEADGGCE